MTADGVYMAIGVILLLVGAILIYGITDGMSREFWSDDE